MKHLKMSLILVATAALHACSNGADNQAAQPAAAAAPRVFIVSPADGATVSSPFTVSFGIEGYAVAPAGTYEPDTGHHHLLIDAELPALDQPLPADGQHIHFGKGQTETQLELTPGEHTLQLILGDGNHIPHATPIVSDRITVIVSAAD